MAALVAMLIAAGFAYWQYNQQKKIRAPDSRTVQNDGRPAPRRPPVQIEQEKFDRSPPPVEAPAGGNDIAGYFRNRQSNVIVAAAGRIAKVLPDDNDTQDGSSRHQRFIVRMADSGTVLLSHNIDLAQRIPAVEGDAIQFKGEYEWTERGGVVHWTHRDPMQRHEDGWIQHKGKRYQ